jgi:hypothetical protein
MSGRFNALGLGSSSRSPSTLASLLAASSLLGGLVLGCSPKGLEQKECDRLRGEAFELINKGQQCGSDADCQQSTWPGCPRPVSHATQGKIDPLAAKAKEGQCPEPATECKPPPEVYCKQGLCVHREKPATSP